MSSYDKVDYGDSFWPIMVRRLCNGWFILTILLSAIFTFLMWSVCHSQEIAALSPCDETGVCSPDVMPDDDEFTMLATSKGNFITINPVSEIQILFPRAGGAYICFSRIDRAHLDEDELPEDFSVIGIKEGYHKKVFPVITFVGVAGDSKLLSANPLVQKLLDRLEIVD